ncbi:MAG: hypothetical protein HY074_14275 [Deltaproteobacteria bacterium]|nr:hypothetical protein [Deltaproteobacteria bacterium]
MKTTMFKSIFKSMPLALATSLVALGGVVAQAQQGTNDDTSDNMRGQFHDACSSDIQKYCADVQPGGGKMVDCLNQHENDLTAACKTLKKEAHDRYQAIHERFEKACGDDVQKFCADVKPGMGRMTDCLSTHENDLTQACKDEKEHLKARHPASKK